MTFDNLLKSNFRYPTVAIFWGLNNFSSELLRPKLRSECSKLGVRLEEFQTNVEAQAMKNIGVVQVPTVVIVHEGSARLAFSGNPEDVRDKLLAAGVIER